jgi:uncharacterized protein YbjT (DUF2867 family)
MLPDKEAQEQVVMASDLDWVLIRLPQFTQGRPNGHLRVLAEGEPGRLGHVASADLARFLVDCAAGTEHSHEAVGS